MGGEGTVVSKECYFHTMTELVRCGWHLFGHIIYIMCHILDPLVDLYHILDPLV